MSNICNDQLIKTSTFILNAFIHVSLLFSFLTILFIYIIKPLSSSKFKEEIDHIIDDQINNAIPNKIDLSMIKTDINNRKKIINDLKNALSIYYKINNEDSSQALNTISIFDNIFNYINNHNNIYNNLINEYSSENNLIKIHNDYVENNAFYLSIILLIITSVLIILDKLSNISCINLTKLLTENLLTFIFIGFIEYWFFINYAFKYIPVKPSLLISSFIDNIKIHL